MRFTHNRNVSSIRGLGRLRGDLRRQQCRNGETVQIRQAYPAYIYEEMQQYNKNRLFYLL